MYLKTLAWIVIALLLSGSGLVLAQRNLVVAPVQLQLPGERPIRLYGESHALVIGAASYSAGWPKLPGVLSDVRAVSAALREQGFRVAEVLDPTLARLEAAMRKFIGDHGQNPDNRLIIYFAGHGHTLKTADGRQRGPRTCLPWSRSSGTAGGRRVAGVLREGPETR